jgi:hypothetical protein
MYNCVTDLQYGDSAIVAIRELNKRMTDWLNENRASVRLVSFSDFRIDNLTLMRTVVFEKIEAKTIKLVE